MKAKLAILISIFLVVSNAGWAQAVNKSEVEFPIITVKAKNICPNDVCGEGYKIDGVSYVPIRIVTESMGATVGWDPDTQTVELAMNAPVAEKKNELEDMYKRDTKILLLELERELELIELLVQQMEAAYEMYEAKSDAQWLLSLSKGKIIERKMASAKLMDKVLEHRKVNSGSKAIDLSILANHVIELTVKYESSLSSLESYVTRGQTADFDNYLRFKRLGLDHTEKAINELADKKIEWESK